MFIAKMMCPQINCDNVFEYKMDWDDVDCEKKYLVQCEDCGSLIHFMVRVDTEIVSAKVAA